MSIGGNTLGLYPEFKFRLDRYHDALRDRFGVDYYVYVGVRTEDTQRYLYERWLEYKDGSADGDPGRAILAAEPGPMARHMYGLAADLRPNPMPRAHLDLAPQFGLLADVPNEPWHIYHKDARILIERGTCKPITDAQVAALRLPAPKPAPALLWTHRVGEWVKALNVRSGPPVGRSFAPVATSVAPGARLVLRKGAAKAADGAWWREVQFEGGTVGWVNVNYLRPI